MSERDGIPLPGRTVPDVVSQLAFRVLGPYKNRARSVLDWAGLRDQQPRLRRDVSTSYGVTHKQLGSESNVSPQPVRGFHWTPPSNKICSALRSLAKTQRSGDAARYYSDPTRDGEALSMPAH